MHLYYSESTDPYYNLALEEYIFANVKLDKGLFMLWQNDNTVVIGRNQNAMKEIDLHYASKMNTRVARRNTGGGTVYHDLGNLNYSFIQDCDNRYSIDFKQFAVPILDALNQLGVQAECNHRNDLVINGRKFSGTAQTVKNGRMLHHGTLLFDSDLDFVRKVLAVKDEVIQGGGVKSVRSQVTNISEHLPKSMSINQFCDHLMARISAKETAVFLQLDEKDYKAIEALRDSKYRTWDWTYGKAPHYKMQKVRSYEGGSLTIAMNVAKNGIIDSITIDGDLLGSGNIRQLEKLLTGKRLKKDDLQEVLSYCEISDYITNLTPQELLEILLY